MYRNSIHASLNLTRMIKKPHDTLPSQHGPHPTTQRLKFWRKTGTPYGEHMVPCSAKLNFWYFFLRQRAQGKYFWKPRSESYKLGCYPTPCDNWKPSYVNLKFRVVHLSQNWPGTCHLSSGKTQKLSTTPQSDFFLFFKSIQAKKCYSGDFL